RPADLPETGPLQRTRPTAARRAGQRGDDPLRVPPRHVPARAAALGDSHRDRTRDGLEPRPRAPGPRLPVRPGPQPAHPPRPPGSPPPGAAAPRPATRTRSTASSPTTRLRLLRQPAHRVHQPAPRVGPRQPASPVFRTWG